jgi:cyanate lyase
MVVYKKAIIRQLQILTWYGYAVKKVILETLGDKEIFP